MTRFSALRLKAEFPKHKQTHKSAVFAGVLHYTLNIPSKKLIHKTTFDTGEKMEYTINQEKSSRYLIQDNTRQNQDKWKS